MGLGLEGDYGYLTLNQEGKKVGDSWDPTKDDDTRQHVGNSKDREDSAASRRRDRVPVSGKW